MKNFIKIEDSVVDFGDCKNCEARCCKGAFGSLFSQILKEEFEVLYQNFPILFIFGSKGFIKPIILISNGYDSCPYLKDNLCSIYEKRPSVCKIYPLSPNLDNSIYIDSSCPEIFKGTNSLDIEVDFFSNYQKSYLDTHFEFDNLKIDDFEELLFIKNMRFFKYTGKESSKYLDFHKLSLENLKNYSFYK